MSEHAAILIPMLRKLMRWAVLDEEDRSAILALPHSLRTFPKGSCIVREGSAPSHCALLLSGFSYRQKTTLSGSRQIVGINIPGDVVDLQNALLPMADHSVQVFTEAEFAMIPVPALKEIAFTRSAVGLALWKETLVDGSIQRQWTVSVGRRNARERIAHFRCECGYRLEAAGLGLRMHYALPMNQEEIADALGLTAIHVNRTLMSMDRAGLTSRRRHEVVIHDWDALATLAEFDPSYLFLDLDAPQEHRGDWLQSAD